jgi:hypothetical protein
MPLVSEFLQARPRMSRVKVPETDPRSCRVQLLPLGDPLYCGRARVPRRHRPALRRPARADVRHARRRWSLRRVGATSSQRNCSERSTPPALSLTPNGQRTARRRRIRRRSTQRCSPPVDRRSHRDQRSQRGDDQTSRRRSMTSSSAAATVPVRTNCVNQATRPATSSKSVVDAVGGPIIVHAMTARPKYMR